MKKSATQTCSLNAALVSLEHAWTAKANRLERKRRSCNNCTHWKARGSQQALREAVKYLTWIRHTHHTLRASHNALTDYVQCLEKNFGDARFETALPRHKRGLPVVQWKAEGECLVLPMMGSAIQHLLDSYAPPINCQLHKPEVEALPRH